MKVAAAALATIAILAFVPWALGGASVNSRVTIDDYRARTDVVVFKGRVASPADACEANRRVSIITRGPGSEGRIGSDFTNAQGAYRITEPLPIGGEEAFAYVRQTTFGGKLTCESARSQRILLAG